jgi:DNA repair protein RadD
MYNLRPYQEEAVKKGVEFLTNPKEKQGAIEILPTGSGKSLVIAGIAKELNEPVLVFQPTKEILEQNYAKLRSYDIECSIYSASLNKKEVSNITFATIGTASNSILKFEDFKYILIDECHRVNPKEGMYSNFLSFVGEKYLGFTATPYRLATNSLGSELRFITRTKPKVFSKVIHLTQISELYVDGFLSPLEYFNIKGFDRKQVKINNTGADFSEKSLFDYCQAINFPHRVYDITNRLL